MSLFCKVCYDSGKSSFDTHRLRDSAGNVICPVLLDTKCKKCGYFGHTSKYCKNQTIDSSIAISNKTTLKSVRFGKDVKSYSLGQVSFCVLAIDDFGDNICHDIDDDIFCGGLDNIVWGVGFIDMIGVMWADHCGV